MQNEPNSHPDFTDGQPDLEAIMRKGLGLTEALQVWSEMMQSGERDIDRHLALRGAASAGSESRH